jgi:hypothetical protein
MGILGQIENHPNILHFFAGIATLIGIQPFIHYFLTPIGNFNKTRQEISRQLSANAQEFTGKGVFRVDIQYVELRVNLTSLKADLESKYVVIPLRSWYRWFDFPTSDDMKIVLEEMTLLANCIQTRGMETEAGRAIKNIKKHLKIEV